MRRYLLLFFFLLFCVIQPSQAVIGNETEDLMPIIQAYKCQMDCTITNEECFGIIPAFISSYCDHDPSFCKLLSVPISCNQPVLTNGGFPGNRQPITNNQSAMTNSGSPEDRQPISCKQSAWTDWFSLGTSHLNEKPTLARAGFVLAYASIYTSDDIEAFTTYGENLAALAILPNYSDLSLSTPSDLKSLSFSSDFMKLSKQGMDQMNSLLIPCAGLVTRSLANPPRNDSDPTSPVKASGPSPGQAVPVKNVELKPESMSGLDSLPPATRGNPIQPSGPHLILTMQIPHLEV